MNIPTNAAPMNPPLRRSKLVATPQDARIDNRTASGSQRPAIAMFPKPSSGARSLTPGRSRINATAIGDATSEPASITDLEVFHTPWRAMSCAMSAGTT